jgi:lysine biosynthesis protein LysW
VAHRTTVKRVVTCVDCGAQIAVSSPLQIGQRIVCPECKTKLEVIDTDPVELDWAYDEYGSRDDDEEDW